MSGALACVEEIIDASATAERIEALLPAGVRPRQLKARTLLVGMTLAMHAGRDALLTGVREALTALPADAQRRLGVIADWNSGPHPLTYRQLEYTFALITKKLAQDKPDGSPSQTLAEVLDRLLEASVQALGEPASSSYAVDWSDLETWSRPPAKKPAGPSDQPPAAGESNTPSDDPQPGREHPAHATPAAARADPEAAWGHRDTNTRQKRLSEHDRR